MTSAQKYSQQWLKNLSIFVLNYFSFTWFLSSMGIHFERSSLHSKVKTWKVNIFDHYDQSGWVHNKKPPNEFALNTEWMSVTKHKHKHSKHLSFLRVLSIKSLHMGAPFLSSIADDDHYISHYHHIISIRKSEYSINIINTWQ